MLDSFLADTFYTVCETIADLLKQRNNLQMQRKTRRKRNKKLLIK